MSICCVGEKLNGTSLSTTQSIKKKEKKKYYFSIEKGIIGVPVSRLWIHKDWLWTLDRELAYLEKKDRT